MFLTDYSATAMRPYRKLKLLDSLVSVCLRGRLVKSRALSDRYMCVHCKRHGGWLASWSVAGLLDAYACLEPRPNFPACPYCCRHRSGYEMRGDLSGVMLAQLNEHHKAEEDGVMFKVLDEVLAETGGPQKHYRWRPV